MPVSPTPPDSYWWEIAQAYQGAELEILALIRDRLDQGWDLDEISWATARLAEIQGLTRQALVILARVNSGLAGGLALILDDAYDAGRDSFLKDARAYAPERPGAVPSAARQAAVASVAQVVTSGLSERLPSMLRRMQDDYSRVVNQTVARVQAGGVDRRAAAQVALNQAFDKGLTMGPANSRGGRLSLPDYMSMAVRTGVANTSIQGHLDAMGMVGLDLVYINPGPRHCDRCDEWANKPLWRTSGPAGWVEVENRLTGKMERVYVYGSLNNAKAAGWGHPNCRCSVGAYLVGATRLPHPRPKWDEKGYEAQQAQRDLERGIRSWKTRESLALTPSDRAKARAKVAQWQKSLRDHLAANPDLKRQSRREQIGRTI